MHRFNCNRRWQMQRKRKLTIEEEGRDRREREVRRKKERGMQVLRKGREVKE